LEYKNTAWHGEIAASCVLEASGIVRTNLDASEYKKSALYQAIHAADGWRLSIEPLEGVKPTLESLNMAGIGLNPAVEKSQGKSLKPRYLDCDRRFSTIGVKCDRSSQCAQNSRERAGRSTLGTDRRCYVSLASTNTRVV